MILINSSSRDSVKIFQSFYPIHPPVGIGFLHVYASQSGIKSFIIDEQIVEDVVETAVEMTASLERPYIFGFSVLTVALNNALASAKKLKSIFPDCKIVFGGHHPTAKPDEILSYDFVDFVIRGEAEEPLVDLYRCLKHGLDISAVENLSYREGSKVVHKPLSYFVKDLNTYPAFPYHLFTHLNYDLGFVFSSRGCPYKCIFCSCSSFPGSATYRYRDEQLVVDDICNIYFNFGIRSIIFVDDNFMVSKSRILKLINLLSTVKFDEHLSFTFQARGDNIDQELISEMVLNGFEVVLFGLETASEQVMLKIKKGETVEQCKNAVKICKDHGMLVGATFVFGLPDETHADRMDCIDLARELNIDFVRFNNAVPYPGTELERIAISENAYVNVNNYSNFIAVATMTENPFTPLTLPYCPPGSTEIELRRDILIAFFATYFRPVKAIQSVLKSAKKGKWLSFSSRSKSFILQATAIGVLGSLIVVKFLQMTWFVFVNKKSRLPFPSALKVLKRLLT